MTQIDVQSNKLSMEQGTRYNLQYDSSIHFGGIQVLVMAF